MYEVIVGKMGTVSQGEDLDFATAACSLYIKESGYNPDSQCYGEDVVLFRSDDVVMMDYIGHLSPIYLRKSA